MRAIARTAMLGAGLAALALSGPLSAAPERLGKQTGQARTNVHRPPNMQTPPHVQRPQGNALPNQNRPKPNTNKPTSRPNAAGGKNNVVAGNTVVVGGRPGHGFYDNGGYHGRPSWDDNDNDFLEFVGKTAAITAGVSVVSAVIGSIVQDKPQGCQSVDSGGQQMLYCNGAWYQPVANGYQVVAPPG